MIMAAVCFAIGVFIGVALASVAAAGKKRDKPLAETTVPVEKLPNWEKVEYITKEQGMAAACKSLCCPGPRCPDTPCVEVEYVFRAVPAADVAKIVRCKVCKWRVGCSLADLVKDDEFFCKEGEGWEEDDEEMR